MHSKSLSKSFCTQNFSKTQFVRSRHTVLNHKNHVPKECTAEQAIKCVKPGDSIFVHTAAAAPSTLVDALLKDADRLTDVQLFNLHLDFSAPALQTENFTAPKYANSFYSNNFFVSGSQRKSVVSGQSGYIPINLGQIPDYLEKIPLQVALLNVSPPDAKGFCTLGVSVDVSWDAALRADIIIAQINPNMPRTYGDGVFHISSFDYIVPVDDPIPVHKREVLDQDDLKIGKLCADLIEDGSTLQMGIGSIPDAVLGCLKDRKDLGIHTEMFSDGVVELLRAGAINNSKKYIDPGVLVTSFAIGDKGLYDFLNDNIEVRFKTTRYTNNIHNVALNPKVVCINSALEIDLTGQVCADSIGARVYSGTGGQLDFARGAASNKEGKFILAMHSCTGRGESKIVAALKPGSGVVTPRTLCQYVVTEYGVANLYGKNLQQRSQELIKIAHPKHREKLERDFLELIGWEAGTYQRWNGLKDRVYSRGLNPNLFHNE